MKYEFVTSMHKPYFDHIGSVMLESWMHHWKKDSVKLIVYGEGFENPYNDPRIEWRDWNEYCLKNHNHYKSYAKGPCITFAKKGFAFLDAMKKTNADRLVWLDADLLFFKEMDYKKFDQLLENNNLVAFFDQYYCVNPKYTNEEYTNKETRTLYGAESGFVMLNPKHKDYNNYVKNYETLYLSEEKDPAITHWYDSEVVVLAARDSLEYVTDLSELRTTNKTATPLNRCWLTEYFNHQKAKSKTQYSIEELRKMCNLG